MIKIILILILIISVFINILLSSHNKEGFNVVPDKLIYLFNTDTACPTCSTFNNTWTSIVNEVSANPFYYKFLTEKYNITTDTQGQTIARDNKINTPPAIVYKSGDNYKIYTDKSKDMTAILEWARKG